MENVAIDRIVSQLAAGNQNMSRLISTLDSRLTSSTGTITWTAAASVTVTDANVLSTSIVLFVPTNASAGTLVGSAKSPYLSARTAGTSFTLTTANAASAAGGETFAYAIINPV